MTKNADSLINELGSGPEYTVVRQAAEYKPIEADMPPAWVRGDCFGISFVRSGNYKRPADRYIKTSEEAAGYFREVYGEPLAEPVFWQGLWRVPIRSNPFFKGE